MSLVAEALPWSHNHPTKPGFYYWQGGLLSGLQVAVVQVSLHRNGELSVSELMVDGIRNGPVSQRLADFGGRWAGPLPQVGCS